MKKFNITGTCVPHLHYMVNIENKVNKVLPLIEEGLYFVISRPRQYGKTTLLSFLYRKLRKSDQYLLIKTSFEGMGDESFENEESFSKSFLLQLSEELKSEKELLKIIKEYKPIQKLKELNLFISDFVEKSNRKVVLIIDEVDKASNFNLFIGFLGMLRDKYLKRADGIDTTFHSVILAGLHDIKNIKLKMRTDSESAYNSPWNIATEFKVDMSFSAEEIETMLVDYIQDLGYRDEGTGAKVTQAHFDTAQCKSLLEDKSTISNPQLAIDNPTPNSQHLIANTQQLSQEIYKYTSGYPFLVSKICKLIEEELEKDWTLDGIQKAVDIILKEQNTLFDDMIKNLENHRELSELIKDVLIDEMDIVYNLDNPIINKALMYGIIKSNEKGKISIHNRIFEVRLYNYLTSKIELSNRSLGRYVSRGIYLDSEGNLDMERVLLKFQEFIKATYSDKDTEFYERHGRLLLIAFIKPIINGTGFYYLESQHSYERRSDMIITFNKKEYILELKLWYGQKYHEEGLKQLAGYLESRSYEVGYLVAFNFNQNKEFTSQWNEVNGKKIFEVLV